MFALSLQEGRVELCNISGLLFSVDWLVKAQGLDRMFRRKRGMTENKANSKKRQQLA
jgi:hypothetical protein